MATTTSLQICNRALLLLGAKKVTAVDGTDTSYRALLCQELYDAKVLEWLTMHPWRFALTIDLIDYQGEYHLDLWKYRHCMPTAALGQILYGLYPVGSDRTRPLAASREYEVYGGEILSNHNSLYGEYWQNVAIASWPGWFVNFVVADLASELAFPVTDQQNVTEYWSIKARGRPSDGDEGGLLGNAKWMNSQNVGSLEIASDDLLSARYAGALW